MKPRRMAALVKPIPRFAVRQRSPNGRLQRDGVALSMNPSCLRVVSQRVALARRTGGRRTARHDCALSCPRLRYDVCPGQTIHEPDDGVARFLVQVVDGTILVAIG
jgi:hypothetical protein